MGAHALLRDLHALYINASVNNEYSRKKKTKNKHFSFFNFLCFGFVNSFILPIKQNYATKVTPLLLLPLNIHFYVYLTHFCIVLNSLFFLLEHKKKKQQRFFHR